MINHGLNNTINQNKDIYSKVTQNISSNKSYLLNSYQTDKIQIYNSPENKKKRSLKIKLGLAFSAITIASIVGAGLLRGKKFDSNTINRFMGSLSNFTTVKDDLYDRGIKSLSKSDRKPVAFIGNKLNQGGEKLTGLYRKLTKKANGTELQKCYDELSQNLSKEQMEKLGIKNYDTFFEEVNGTILKAVKEERPTKNLFSKEGVKKVFKGNLADPIIEKEEIIQKAYSDIKIPDDMKLDDEIISKIENYSNAKNNTAKILIPKLRDVNVGSAPTDVITILGPLALFGGMLKFADTKEEKKALTLDLGLPLMGSLISTTIGIAKSLAGFKLMVFGFAFGKLVSMGVKSIDKAITKRKAEKNA